MSDETREGVSVTKKIAWDRNWSREMRRVRLCGRMAHHGPWAWQRKPRVFTRVRYLVGIMTYEAEIRCWLTQRPHGSLTSIYGEKPLPRAWRKR